MIKFSIIVPVYNSELFLEKCILSVLSQSYTNLELLLVDDGSTDKSPIMCDNWAKKDNRIKVIHKENGGVSSARNEGIRQASGEYLLFLDADDYLINGVLEECNQHIDKLLIVDYLNFASEDNYLENVKVKANIFPTGNYSFSSEEEKFNFLNNLLYNKYLFTVCWRGCYKASFLRENNLFM